MSRPVADEVDVTAVEASVPAARGPNVKSVLTQFSFGRATGVTIGLIIVCVFLWISQPEFMTWWNWQNIFRTQGVVAILAIGTTFVVLTGQIDLSIASGTAAAAMILGEAIQHGWSWFPALIACLAMGLLLGLANGTLIGVFKIPFFVVTLGSLSIYQSVAELMTQGSTISLFGVSRFNPIANVTNNSVGPFPNLLLICIGMYLVAMFVLRYTRFGRAVFAIGSNREAARLTGVKVSTVIICVYLISGLTVGLGAAAQAGRLTAADPVADPNLMLNVVAAVLIGGTAFTGGDGSLGGTIIGVLFLGVIQNGLSLSGISTFWQGTVSGVILIAAVAIGVLRDYGWRRDLVMRLVDRRRRAQVSTE
jgi:ribose/xylose/arabinose/galactoside ABC-type transport system permease subunit